MSTPQPYRATAGESQVARARTFLFVPADRPERYQTALSSGADAIVLDLEDSVPLFSKDKARKAVRDHWPAPDTQTCAVLIRINSPNTVLGQQDIADLQHLTGMAGVMVPKCDSAATLRHVATAWPGIALLPMIESATGYLFLPELANTPQVNRLVVGHIDFLADTGLTCSDDQHELNHLRFQVAMWSRLANLAPAVDGITVACNDPDMIRLDVERSLRFGFGAKLCIHPRQVPWVHAAMKPTPAQIRWAQRIVSAMDGSQGAAVQIDGKMVDLPVLVQAQRMLARAIDVTPV